MTYAATRRVFPRDVIAAGRDRVAGGVRAMTDRVLARFAPIGEPGPGGVAEDAAAFALFGGAVADAFLAWQRELGGLPRAVEMLVASAQWTHVRFGAVRAAPVELAVAAAPRARVLRRARPAIGLVTRHDESRYGPSRPWSWIRRHVRAAAPDELAALRALADRTRPWVVRAALAYALAPVADIYTPADLAEARTADLLAAHIRFGILAALRAHPFTEAALEAIDTTGLADLGSVGVTTGQMIALGAHAVTPLRFARAYGELRVIGDTQPDAFRALVAFADEPSPAEAALAEIDRLPARRATVAALAPMFAPAARPVAHLAPSRAVFRALVAGLAATDPDAARELAPETAAELGAALPADPARPPAWTAKAPKLPAWLAPATLPRPIRDDGATALTTDQLAQLLQLQKADADKPELDPRAAAADLDAASLALLAWTVFQRWLRAGGPPKDKWALFGLGLFGDDAIAARLGSYARQWAAGAHVARAQLAVDALALQRSHAALVEIDAIARAGTSPALRTRARAVLGAIADELGLTADDLADRLVPELAADDLVFAGERVAFDADLTPTLAAPLDDPEEAQRFADLGKLTKQVARAQQARLERALADGARMTYAHFSEVYLMHVLLRELARGVVWIAETDAARTPFRIAADGTPVDVLDRPFDLPLAARYGVAHPVELTADELAAWRARFPHQRVDQLARATFPADTAHACARRLAALVGTGVRAAAIRAALYRGWTRADGDGNRYDTLVKRGATWSCRVRFAPGIAYQRDAVDEAQAISAIELRAQGDPPRVVLSELERDLRQLA